MLASEPGLEESSVRREARSRSLIKSLLTSNRPAGTGARGGEEEKEEEEVVEEGRGLWRGEEGGGGDLEEEEEAGLVSMAVLVARD